jgi:hypothetical protein
LDKEKTINDLYKEAKSSETPETAAELEQEKEKRAKILEMIDKNINRKYFSERKIDPFFTQCFSLKRPDQFIQDEPRFSHFINDDLKLIVQSVKEPANLVEFTKFAVFFKLSGEDPELFELLADQIKKNCNSMTVD